MHAYIHTGGATSVSMVPMLTSNLLQLSFIVTEQIQYTGLTSSVLAGFARKWNELSVPWPEFGIQWAGYMSWTDAFNIDIQVGAHPLPPSLPTYLHSHLSWTDAFNIDIQVGAHPLPTYLPTYLHSHLSWDRRGSTSTHIQGGRQLLEMHTPAHMHAHILVHACTHACTHACMHTCMHTCIQGVRQLLEKLPLEALTAVTVRISQVRACMCACVHVCMCVCVYVCMCVLCV